MGFLRLITLFYQYERSYDLYSMPSKEIFDKLIDPLNDFDKFKSRK